jgi:hypothetical protein
VIVYVLPPDDVIYAFSNARKKSGFHRQWRQPIVENGEVFFTVD